MESIVFGNSLADKDVGRSSSKHEKINNPNDEKWKTLNECPEWRKCLSSLHSHHVLEIDGEKFSTPEHYFQFRKFEVADENVAREFCVGGKYGEIDGKSVRRLRKLVMLTSEEWKQWESIEKECKEKIRLVKFAPGTLCHKILLATHSAQLWSIAPRCPAVRMYKTEMFRDQLRESNSM